MKQKDNPGKEKNKTRNGTKGKRKNSRFFFQIRYKDNEPFGEKKRKCSVYEFVWAKVERKKGKGAKGGRKIEKAVDKMTITGIVQGCKDG